MKLRIAIILARGGSKRLPRKNILPFFGRPMLAWSIQAALDSNCFDRVLVSTDDDEIAEIGRQAGAEVPFLRQAAADDQSSSSLATRVALMQAENYWSEEYGVIAQLMANCPMRTSVDICNAVMNFEAVDAPSQISAFRYGWMNPWWAAELGANKEPKWLFPDTRSIRSQDLPPLYCPSGAIWLANRDDFLSSTSFYTEHHILFELSWISALDIDDDADFAMAKAFMYLQLNQNFKLPGFSI